MKEYYEELGYSEQDISIVLNNKDLADGCVHLKQLCRTGCTCDIRPCTPFNFLHGRCPVGLWPRKSTLMKNYPHTRQRGDRIYLIRKNPKVRRQLNADTDLVQTGTMEWTLKERAIADGEYTEPEVPEVEETVTEEDEPIEEEPEEEVDED